MNPKKQKLKDRRRARKLADEAWDAVQSENLDLAEKIIRRAVIAQADNPILWNDQGVILARRHKDAEADEAFRTALSLAPTFAEPYAHLAAMRIRQGRAREAVSLQTQAVKYAPDRNLYAEQLDAYRSLAGADAPGVAATAPAKATTVEPLCSDVANSELIQRVADLDWERLSERLTREGIVLVQKLLDPLTCAQLCGMFDDDDRFAKTVVMDRPDFGRGVYRYFLAPIPDAVDRLRRVVYPAVAKIANGWQALLGRPDRFPAEWDAFRDECHAAGQMTPTPILLKYTAGGFNALHRDLRGTVFFPVQLAVVLSPRADGSDAQAEGFRGGDFLFSDFPERRKAQRREIPAGLGDAVLFCTRDRPVSVGGVFGLQPVKHGVTEITAGVRFVLGVPFHEYR